MPTTNVPAVNEKFAKRTGLLLQDILSRRTEEMMTRELGITSTRLQLLLEKDDLWVSML